MDVQKRLRKHIELTRKRDMWARRAIDLLAQGKRNQGRAAAERAEHWDAKVKALEG